MLMHVVGDVDEVMDRRPSSNAETLTLSAAAVGTRWHAQQVRAALRRDRSGYTAIG